MNTYTNQVRQMRNGCTFRKIKVCNVPYAWSHSYGWMTSPLGTPQLCTYVGLGRDYQGGRFRLIGRWSHGSFSKIQVFWKMHKTIIQYLGRKNITTSRTPFEPNNKLWNTLLAEAKNWWPSCIIMHECACEVKHMNLYLHWVRIYKGRINGEDIYIIVED